MARIRSIKPEYFEDPDLAEISLEAAYIFPRLWQEADARGILRLEAEVLWAKLFALRYAKTLDERYSPIAFRRYIEELQGENPKRKRFAIAYEVDGRLHLIIPSFGKHQQLKVSDEWAKLARRQLRGQDLPTPPPTLVEPWWEKLLAQGYAYIQSRPSPEDGQPSPGTGRVASPGADPGASPGASAALPPDQPAREQGAGSREQGESPPSPPGGEVVHNPVEKPAKPPESAQRGPPTCGSFTDSMRRFVSRVGRLHTGPWPLPELVGERGVLNAVIQRTGSWEAYCALKPDAFAAHTKAVWGALFGRTREARAGPRNGAAGPPLIPSRDPTPQETHA